MGCLILLILAFVFRGAIFGLIAWLFGAFISVLTLALSLGFWGIIAILVLCAIVAALR